MKRFAILMLLLGFYVAGKAQDTQVIIKGSNKISKEMTPKEIIDSLHKRFPNAEAVQYYKTSENTIKAGWNVEEENTMGAGDELEKYTLSFKRSDFKYYALFDAHGNLLKSTYEEYDTKLPDAVKASIKKLLGDNYKDYTALSKTHYKLVDNQNHKEYYEVTVVNKNDKNNKKMITLAPDGTVIKEQ